MLSSSRRSPTTARTGLGSVRGDPARHGHRQCHVRRASVSVRRYRSVTSVTVTGDTQRPEELVVRYAGGA